MNSPVEERLRAALAEAGATIDPDTLRPLRAAERRRARVDARLVTAGAAVVVATAATVAMLGFGLGDAAGEDRVVAAGPSLAEPGNADMTIVMCADGPLLLKEERCQGRAATAEQVREAERAALRLPQVESAYTVSQSLAYDNVRADFARNRTILDAVKVTDLPVSIRLAIREGEDHRKVEEALRDVPAVLGVFDNAATEAELSAGQRSKALLNVFLCAKGSALPACGARTEPGGDGPGGVTVTKEGKAVTLAQKKAIQRVIAGLPQVEEVTFEDQRAAYENFRRTFASNKALLNATKVSDLPESFRVLLKPEADWAGALAVLRRQPGVASAAYLPCQRDRLLALSRYGLSLSDDQVCSPGG
ncbi:permease-like cell division protein FtsX [Actinomadura sp. ATCC 31491]|uniref:Permease-like cell division protein FtsX n=1 Tax=Actinomadura luzonensis TaxID=2805427 RepID=A0ABT0FP20_9ACTN|nr:permease-like cell division protein FtsX [Actinomadura luzonensis]MCK2214004.1 permease-like cell division protein FtsX [Actinomadura luzonensis]